MSLTRDDREAIERSKGPGGDCWLLLRSARVEAEELKRDITSVLDQLENLNPANRQYGEALQFEHSQLSELRKMKQVQMEKLADRLSFLDQQPASCRAAETPTYQQHFSYASPCSSIDRPIPHADLAAAAEDAEEADVNYLDEDEQADSVSEPASPSWPELRRASVPDVAAYSDSAATEDADVNYPNDEETEWRPVSPGWGPDSSSTEWGKLGAGAAFSGIVASEDADVSYPNNEETGWQEPATPDSSSKEPEWEPPLDVAAFSDSAATEDADINYPNNGETGWQPASPDSSSKEPEWVQLHDVAAFSDSAASQDADISYPSDVSSEWQPASPDSSSEQSEWESLPNVAAFSGITAASSDADTIDDDNAEWQPATPRSFSRRMASKQIEWEPMPNHVSAFDEIMAARQPVPTVAAVKKVVAPAGRLVHEVAYYKPRYNPCHWQGGED